MGLTSQDAFEQAYALSRKYTDVTVLGGGALKGKNCVISSISDITGGKRVTFQWTLDDGTEQTGTMDVLNGAKGETGVGIKAVTINSSNHLIITYDDNTTEDAGELKDFYTDFSHIRDVDLSNLEDGQILKYNASTQKWENASAGTVSTNLEDLNDVDIENPTDGQLVAWDATSGRWVAVDAPEGGLSADANALLGAHNILHNRRATNPYENGGVTYTKNSDGSISCSGTVTADKSQYAFQGSGLGIEINKFAGKKVRLSGCPAGGSAETYFLDIWWNDTSHMDTGEGVVVTLPDPWPNVVNVNITCRNGVDMTGKVFYPMITLDGDNSTIYQPWVRDQYDLNNQLNITDAQQKTRITKVSSPTVGNFPALTSDGQLSDSGKNASDFATPVNVADVQAMVGLPAGAGKNLLPAELYNKQASITNRYVTLTITNNSFHFSGTASENGGRLDLKTNTIILPVGDYVVSVPSLLVDGVVVEHGSSVVASLSGDTLSTSFNIPSEEDVYIGFNVKQGVTYDGNQQVMIRPAGTSADYVPYAASAQEQIDAINFYLEQTVTLSTSATTTATFSNAKITANSLIDIAVSEWGLVPDDVTVSAGTCTVTMPKVDSAHSVTVRIYVR